MTHSSTVYYIESQGDSQPRKIVIHTPGTKYHKFLEGKKATAFRDRLKAANPAKQYRRVKETTTYNEGEWI